MKPHITVLSPGADNPYEGAAPDRILTQVFRPELHSYTVARPKGRVLICAGGGYTRLMLDKEGTEPARWLNSLDFDAHVLVHRLPGFAGHPYDIALQDGLRALDHLTGAGAPVFILGLSSGGHLAGVLACHRPELAGLIMAYAPLCTNHADHRSPPDRPDLLPSEKQAFYSEWPVGAAACPQAVPRCPMLLFYGLSDTTVPVENALTLIRTARDLSLDLEAHIYGQAPHGFALRDQSGTHAFWPETAARWLLLKCPAG